MSLKELMSMDRSKPDFKGYLMGEITKFAGNFILPIAAGAYVGFQDSVHAPLDPATKYTLLASSTLLRAGVQAAARGAIKSVNKIASQPGVIDKIAMANHTPIEKAYIKKQKLEELANKSVTKDVMKVSVLPSISTGIGYALGYLSGKFTQ